MGNNDGRRILCSFGAIQRFGFATTPRDSSGAAATYYRSPSLWRGYFVRVRVDDMGWTILFTALLSFYLASALVGLPLLICAIVGMWRQKFAGTPSSPKRYWTRTRALGVSGSGLLLAGLLALLTFLWLVPFAGP